MIDASRSMAEPAKFDMARRLAAALCYIGLAHLDRMTILSFGARLGAETSPGRGKGRIFKVFELLEQMQASGATDLRRSIKEFASRPRLKGLTVILSDFLDPQGVEGGPENPSNARPRRVRRARHVESATATLRRSAKCSSSMPRPANVVRSMSPNGWRQPTSRRGTRTPRSSKSSADGTGSATCARMPSSHSTRSSSTHSARVDSSHDLRRDVRLEGVRAARRSWRGRRVAVPA